jgi:hypothetical protein
MGWLRAAPPRLLRCWNHQIPTTPCAFALSKQVSLSRERGREIGEPRSLHYSMAGLLGSRSRIVATRPFRAPHHTASCLSLVGRWIAAASRRDIARAARRAVLDDQLIGNLLFEKF